MSESSNRRPIFVGLFTLLGLLFLAAGILVIGNIRETFGKKVHIVAYFDDVGGLQTGNNIWFSGVKIGIIKAIELSGKSKVKVVMNINKSAVQYIRKDARAQISTDGLIGNKIILISGGSWKSDPVSKGDSLAVETPVSTEDLLNTLKDSNTNIKQITSDLKNVSQNLRKGEGSLGRLLKEEVLYNNLNTAAASLMYASEKANLIMNTLAVLSQKLNQKGNLMADLATDTMIYKSVTKTVLDIQSISDSASALINGLKRSAANPKTPAGLLLNNEQSANDLQATFKHLNSSSEKLDKTLEALQHSFLLRRYLKKEAKKK
jgi:phospholipid/cholesterol/gamma-HCH transport system substrate-binding protein